MALRTRHCDIEQPTLFIVATRQAFAENVSSPVVVDVRIAVVVSVLLPLAKSDRIVERDRIAIPTSGRKPTGIHIGENDDGMFEPLCRMDRLDGHRIHASTRIDIVSAALIDTSLDEPNQIPTSLDRRVVNRLNRR